MSEFKKLSQRERERQRRIERRTRPEQWCDWDTKQALCAVAKRLAQVRWAVTRKRGFDRANVLNSWTPLRFSSPLRVAYQSSVRGKQDKRAGVQ